LNSLTNKTNLDIVMDWKVSDTGIEAKVIKV